MCDIQGPVKCGDVTSLVTACTAALSSSRVAEDFVTVVDRLCGGKPENRVACVGAGVIEAVVAALNAHGRNSARIAAKGCVALNAFSCGNRANSDAIVIAHGLDAICLALVSHCRIEEVQREGCWALWFLACAASAEAVSVMLAGQAVELLRAAKKNFPEGGHGSVKGWADLTLAQLQLEVPDADPLTAGSKRDATRPTT